ncbi:MAG: DUF4922 domain-containing protein [Fermentimonas sp.]|jgi:hypothetical protein|nr:DUF4922 domain-containing protein [Fermentimonas sp.]HBT86576.1 DUF4922 domain-containing protein [Porphyromonadaceae bacterium]MDD2930470.1 DUF4922 domain-containing protein [Fermentimonas sp.]MDD3188875.1 DUF4922 domain-containing protein [Fermentimonas sp.]MDD3510916.1 DUF4922 domain-containing protein [Fermentimonas sp.]
MGLQNDIENLFSFQKNEWPKLNESISILDEVREKQFNWGDNFSVKVQFNPARITSTGANTDYRHINGRPCFICEQNRPTEQKGIVFLEKYIILCNPFPILRNHITIPLHSHVPQRIRNKIGEMLTLTEKLPDYVVFYNGPKSGASAPDHFHLQAGLKVPELMQGDNELRSCLMIEGESITESIELFEEVYQYLRYQQPEEEEPMLNVITFMEDNKYKTHIFPRKLHRPKQFYAEGSKKLLISPGALDMAGIIITVREEDFDKIDKQDIEDIYVQVSLPIM